MTPVVVTPSASGLALAKRIAEIVQGRLLDLSTDGFAPSIRQAFLHQTPVIGVCASGILIRIIAPLITDKHKEPPVIAVAEDGSSVVPLLGGHHGANRLAGQISAALGAHAALTTASDVRFSIALDDPPEGFVLRNPKDTKAFTSGLLSGEKIKLQGRADWLERSNLPFCDQGKLTISITTQEIDGDGTHLVYHPQSLCLGVGCERGTRAQEMYDLVTQTLHHHQLSPHSIAGISSIDLKADEAAILRLGDHLCRPIRFFSADELNAQETRLKNPSELVRQEVGCPGVSEAAALASAGTESQLLVEKTKSKRATCALALAPAPVTTFPGKRRGALSVVGLGPGDPKWRSPEAMQTLLEADDWVGYGLYLDLAGDLMTNQCQHRFALGEEEVRVRHALRLAGEGRRVALICSGDANIYAMGALAAEIMEQPDILDAERRIELMLLPGISAFQAAAARTGALIGHDFCCISLSDLLTPWPVIEQRITAAAAGDFVTCFYNPRSLKRTDQLSKAVDIMGQHRPCDTPVIIASNLGRAEEKTTIVRLADVEPETIDMLTIVLIGSSTSRCFERPDGDLLAYTPRGYAKKRTRP